MDRKSTQEGNFPETLKKSSYQDKMALPRVRPLLAYSLTFSLPGHLLQFCLWPENLSSQTQEAPPCFQSITGDSPKAFTDMYNAKCVLL